MSAVVPGRWVNDPDLDATHGLPDGEFCQCGEPLNPTQFWVHANDLPFAGVGLAPGWCCPECCDRRYEPCCS